MAYIELDAVEKTFEVADGDVQALESVSLGIEQQEFVSLVGPSGCGKSTLLRIIAGLIAPTAGEVRVAGERIRAPRPDVGVVFQSPVLLPWRSVIENVMLPVDVAGKKRATYRERAEQLLELVGLEGFGRMLPWQLSGGMQQRASICRALILEPRILLMDEPFGALDAMTRDEMGVELLRIWSSVGATVLFITHSIPEAVFLSDRVAVMSSRPGRIQEELQIGIPRPRGLDTYRDAQFMETTERIRTLIESVYMARRDAARTADAG